MLFNSLSDSPYAQIRVRSHIYKRMVHLFYDADDRYNSGLFHFKKEKDRSESPDELTMHLDIDDKPLKEIIQSLYYPQCPYEFSVLPADILGHVYEQFLGKVIRLTAGHRAVVEDKPEVKKAGGVYYTPTYIVDYIVKNTVGRLLDPSKSPPVSGGDAAKPRGGATRKLADKIKILDPACGSGSFLIGAYQYLLDWYRDRYVDEGPEKHVKSREPKLYQAAGGEWKLTTSERKRILLNHIFGVDIDPQAVEVTKLSLLLKVLEGQTENTLASQLKLFHERALPDLGNNIKCGNSLIGPDFYENRQMSMLDDDERRKINIFDWNAGFHEIIQSGGFDAVIGNPPWGASFSEIEKRYIDKHYHLNSGKYESYIFFVERATTYTKKLGLFGFIIPNYWVSRSQTEVLRKHLSEHMTPIAFIVWPDNLFKGVKMDACIVVSSNTPSLQNLKDTIFVGEVPASKLKNISHLGVQHFLNTVPVGQWLCKPSIRFNPRILLKDLTIFDKIILNSIHLSTLVEISQGLTLYRKSTLIEKYGKAKADDIFEKRLFHANCKKDNTFKKELLGKDISRYYAQWNGKSWVSYGPWLAHAVDERFFHGPRLVIQKIRNPSLNQRLVVAYLDDNETYSAGVLLNAIPINFNYSLFYVLALLNSKLINWWYRKNVIDVSIRVVDLQNVPIHSINFSESAEKTHHNKMMQFAKSMLILNKQKAIARAQTEQEMIQRQIDATDHQIDKLVFNLYDLTDEEIRIVEGG